VNKNKSKDDSNSTANKIHKYNGVRQLKKVTNYKQIVTELHEQILNTVD